MSTFGNKSFGSAPRPWGAPGGQISKWSSKPVSKPVPGSLPNPGLFGNRRALSEGVPTNKVVRELKKGLTIPGAGGAMYKKEQFDKILKERLSYSKVNARVNPQEVKNILRQLRHAAAINPSKAPELDRQRRTFEGKFEKMGLKLKGKY